MMVQSRMLHVEDDEDKATRLQQGEATFDPSHHHYEGARERARVIVGGLMERSQREAARCVAHIGLPQTSAPTINNNNNNNNNKRAATFATSSFFGDLIENTHSNSNNSNSDDMVHRHLPQQCQMKRLHWSDGGGVAVLADDFDEVGHLLLLQDHSNINSNINGRSSSAMRTSAGPPRSQLVRASAERPSAPWPQAVSGSRRRFFDEVDKDEVDEEDHNSNDSHDSNGSNFVPIAKCRRVVEMQEQADDHDGFLHPPQPQQQVPQHQLQQQQQQQVPPPPPRPRKPQPRHFVHPPSFPSVMMMTQQQDSHRQHHHQQQQSVLWSAGAENGVDGKERKRVWQPASPRATLQAAARKLQFAATITSPSSVAAMMNVTNNNNINSSTSSNNSRKQMFEFQV